MSKTMTMRFLHLHGPGGIRVLFLPGQRPVMEFSTTVPMPATWITTVPTSIRRSLQ